MKRALFTLSLLLTGLARSSEAPAEAPKKPAWEWTDEERIAALRDPEAAAARLRAHKAQMHLGGIGVEGSGHTAPLREPVDVIDGRRDPHLFFEWELFDHLIATTFNDSNVQARDSFRRIRVRDAAGIFEVPPEFWERLGAISAAFIEDKRREREVAYSDRPTAEQNGDSTVLYDALCRDRIAALDAAKREFGPGFRRFLYGPVASGRSMASTARRDVDRLLWVGRGCQ